jgi:hypothetical protein
MNLPTSPIPSSPAALRSLSLAGLVAATLVLGGCATSNRIDTDVQAFSTLPAVPANARYRFVRLPSQEARPVQQAQLEALAQQALERVGMRRDDGADRFSVEVHLGTVRQIEPDPWANPWGGWGPGWGLGLGYGRGGYGRGGYYGGGFGAWGGGYPYGGRVTYRHELALILRDQPSGQAVYETHAVSESWRSADGPARIAAMLDAALYGFPRAPQGVRRITAELAPQPAVAPPAPAAR